MPWYLSLALDTPLTPADQATSSVTGLVLGYGPIGVAVLALAWLMFRGWRLTSPAQEAAARAAAREEARADLLRENEHVNAKLEQTEAQRDEALKVAQVELVPVLVQFTNTTTALIPLMQEAVRNQEGRGGGRR